MTIEPMLTNAGISLLLRAIAGEEIIFTRFACGKGDVPSNPTLLTDLVDRVMDFGCDEPDESESGYIKIPGSFSSSDVETDFQWRETGLYCKADGDDDDVLYAYCHYGTGTEIVANDSVLTEQQVIMIVAIGTASHVTVQISASALYASKEDFEEHIAARNPHGTTKGDVGLGSVPNVATNDQTPTYTAPGSVTELVSGEKLSVAFGKIKAAITALIAHLASRNNPHGVTLAQVGGAAASHTHAAGAIISGILSPSRGGTGVSSIDNLARELQEPLMTPRTYSQDLNDLDPGIVWVDSNAQHLPTGQVEGFVITIETAIVSLMPSDATPVYNSSPKVQIFLSEYYSTSGSLPATMFYRMRMSQTWTDWHPAVTSDMDIAGIVRAAGLTYADFGAAAASHSHSAGDISSGAVAVSHGGTGRTAMTTSSSGYEYRGIKIQSTVPSSVDQGCIVLVYGSTGN